MNWWGEYIGVPFKEKGRALDGFDCWGLFKWVYQYERPGGIILPSYDELYTTTNDRYKLSNVIFDETHKHWQEKPAGIEFDAIILRMRGVPMHVGIVTKPGHMLHCAKGMDTVHERYDSIRWKDRILGFYRYE